MSKKRKSELWVAPQYSLKGPNGERTWENRHVMPKKKSDLWVRPQYSLKGSNEERTGGTLSNTRYLELADIALGLKKPESKKRKPHAATRQAAKKVEPYCA